MPTELFTVSWTCDNCGKTALHQTPDKHRYPPDWGTRTKVCEVTETWSYPDSVFTYETICYVTSCPDCMKLNMSWEEGLNHPLHGRKKARGALGHQ